MVSWWIGYFKCTFIEFSLSGEYPAAIHWGVVDQEVLK